MTPEEIVILVRVLTALVVGASIGFERTFHGRSYRLRDGGKLFEYGMVIKTRNRQNADALSEHLRRRQEVLEFRIAPTGD